MAGFNEGAPGGRPSLDQLAAEKRFIAERLGTGVSVIATVVGRNGIARSLVPTMSLQELAGRKSPQVIHAKDLENGENN